jgi:hypothetical protein
VAAAWPDPRWHLLLNPRLPLESFIDSADVVRVASSELVDHLPGTVYSAQGGARPTVVQKPMTLDQLVRYLQESDHRVAGYVHRLEDVAHLDTPARLVEGLALDYPGSPFSAGDEMAFLLRWPVVGAELYRVPYGGTDAGAMRAIDGWVVEEAAFTGTGFVPMTVPPIQEYKVDSLRLPHRAEIFRIDRAGGETLVALYDADRDGWLLVDREAVDQ